MISLYRYFLSLSLLLLPLLAVGQVDNAADTVIERMKTPETSPLSQPFRLTAIRFGIDLNPWVQSIASSERDLYNVHLRLDANSGSTLRYGALLDFTKSEARLEGDSATYNNSGTAARVGLYLNVIPIDPDYNLVTIGLGYGRSWFDESLSGVVEDKLYGSFPISRSSTGLRAGWVEIRGGMQARLWKQLYAGYDLQLKLFPHFKDQEQVQLYEIPGFGRANQKSAFAFSYYLLYRIPFSKKAGSGRPQPPIAK